jgi:hypothetical protein
MKLHPMYDRLILLDRIESSYDFAERTLVHIPEVRRAETGVCGVWSVKDVVAHLTHWEQRALRWLEEAAQGIKLTIPEAGYGWGNAEFDRLNDFYYLRDQAKDWDEVLADWHSAQSDLLALVEDLNDEELAGGGRFAGMFSDSPAGAIADTTFLHYELHVGQIRAWVSG